MGGEPVWLASYSRRDKRKRIVATDTFDRTQRARAKDVLLRALDGVGDPSRYRLFRMQVTTCLHRVLTDDESARIGACPIGRPTYIAGNPVEVLEESGVPDIPSTRPCATPRRVPLVDDNPRLWLPVGCGECDPCKARAAIEAPRSPR